MGGEWLALGAVGALAMLGRSRGSRSSEIFYHCGRLGPGQKFDLKQVGTGEGAVFGMTSAFGPGLYFSTSRDVAAVYCKYVPQPHMTRVRIHGRLADQAPTHPVREGIEDLLRQGFVGVRVVVSGTAYGDFAEVAVYDPSAIEIVDTVPVKRDGSRSFDRFGDLLQIIQSIREEVREESDEWRPKDEPDVDPAEYHRLLMDRLPPQGFPIIGLGGDRMVVRFDEHTVAKIATDSDGDRQNWAEYEMWTDEREGDAGRFLVPVRRISEADDVLLMDYARPVRTSGERDAPHQWTTQLDARRRALSRHLQIYDASSSCNWGWHKGELKVLDYGNHW